MSQSLRDKWVFAGAILIGVTPFAFAALRAFTTGYDVRYIWLAMASFAGASLVMLTGRAGSRDRTMALGLSVAALVVATLSAGLAGLLLGTKAGAGLLIVAFGFGLCSAGSFSINSLMRPWET